jgi:hypothetical protein
MTAIAQRNRREEVLLLREEVLLLSDRSQEDL